MKFTPYRYHCLTVYRNLRNQAQYPQELITFHVRRFDRTMQRYNKKRNISNGSIDLAKRLACDFIEKGKLTKKDLICYLKRIGKCHALDFYVYELFYAFIILYSIDKLYHKENTDAILQLLRDLEVMDFEAWMPYACADEKALLTDYDYACMSRKSKQIYRENVMKMAKKEGKTPTNIIQNIIKLAQKDGKHIGFYLKTPSKPIIKWIYFTFLWGSIVIMSLQLYLISKNLWLSLLIWIPAYITSKIFANQFILSFFKPKEFLRLNPSSSVVQKIKTGITIYAVLNNNSDLLAQKLETVYCQNRNVNGAFCLLLDLPPANKKWMAGEKLCISEIRDKINALNRKYGTMFYVYPRKRTFSMAEEQYICSGGKSGALDEYIHAKRNNDYVLLLDADINTPDGSILDLISVACHPNNQRYGILIPKVIYKDSMLNTKMHNQFNQFIYGQDAFEGIGLIHVDSYRKFKNQLPCGYISDISFISQAQRTVASELAHEFTRFKDTLLTVKQKGITKLRRYMLIEKCIEAVAPFFSFLIVLLSALFEKENFLFYGVAACLPYFAPTYKRLIHQIITGHALSDPNRESESNIKILLYSFQRSIWKFLLLPYRALNVIKVAQKGNTNHTKPSDIFAWYPFLSGAALNLFLGIYFLTKIQWQSIIFLVWAIVPAIVVIRFHFKHNKVALKQRRIRAND